MMPRKIACFTNYLDNIGGAEILTLILARELSAEIYTTNINQEKINQMGFSNVNIRSIGKVPLNPPFRQQTTLSRFKNLKLGNKYDYYIISGDWAISGAVNNKPNIQYFHSPVNEILEFKDFVRSKLEAWKRPLFDVWVLFNRFLYRRYFKHVEKRSCNSKNTQRKVQKYLGKNAIVIYPPIETAKYKFNKSGDFWLSVNRLAFHKRIEIQMEAFSKLPEEKLIIVGSYEKGARHFESYKSYLEKIKPANVDIINWVSDKDLLGLYANCKGFITTTRNEDFGMTPVEAMASGKPVIAPNEGGYRETVLNGKTGILIDNIDSDKLKRSICLLKENPSKYKDACIERAKSFDKSAFIDGIKNLIHEQYE